MKHELLSLRHELLSLVRMLRDTVHEWRASCRASYAARLRYPEARALLLDPRLAGRPILFYPELRRAYMAMGTASGLLVDPNPIDGNWDCDLLIDDIKEGTAQSAIRNAVLAERIRLGLHWKADQAGDEYDEFLEDDDGFILGRRIFRIESAAWSRDGFRNPTVDYIKATTTLRAGHHLGRKFEALRESLEPEALAAALANVKRVVVERLDRLSIGQLDSMMEFYRAGLEGQAFDDAAGIWTTAPGAIACRECLLQVMPSKRRPHNHWMHATALGRLRGRLNELGAYRTARIMKAAIAAATQHSEPTTATPARRRSMSI